MKGINEIIYDFTLSYFKEAIPDYTDEQLEFAKDITEQLILDRDTSKVNVIPAPCGFGKSVIIRCYLKASILSRTFWGFTESSNRSEYKGNGFVVITDLLKRFNEYEEEEDLKGYYYFMNHEKEENFQEQVIEQNNFPILLMTTQKYFKLKENEREFIFKWKHGERKTVIFDEKPLFYEIIEIDKEFINDIDNEIGRIDETEDKNFLNNEVKYLKDYLENEWYRLSSKSNNDVVCYWKGTRKNIGTDDNSFVELTNKYLSPESKDKINMLKEVLEDGAIFVNKKNKNSSDNRRYFFTIKDNKDGFYLGQDKAKFWIFDATADVDVEYGRNYIKIFKVNHTKDYKVNIQNIDIGTSRNNIRNSKELKVFLNRYLENNHDKDSLIVSYLEFIQNINFAKENKENFNGLKGINDHRDKTEYIQIGLNRYSDIAYLQIYLSLNPKIVKYMKENPNKSDEIFDILLEMEYGNFTHDGMNEIMYSKLLVDVEQNIFRTKLRSYSNTDIVNVYLYYNANTYKKLNEELMVRLGIGDISVCMPLELLEYDVMSRENKKPSVAQKIVGWFRNNEGYGEIKTKDLLIINGITDEQFKYAKRENESLVKIMDSRRIKRGIYIA